MEKMVNGLRKIAGASIFWLKQQHICTCVYIYCIYAKQNWGENSGFNLFAANRKRKQQPSVCLLQTETEVYFPLSTNDKWYLFNNCCLSQGAHLCLEVVWIEILAWTLGAWYEKERCNFSFAWTWKFLRRVRLNHLNLHFCFKVFS